MAIDLFDPNNQPSGGARYSDDVVGKFRSGYQINKRPASLSAWRVTTGDPDVADYVSSQFDGDQPQEWDATGEDNLEVFTKAESVDIILAGTSAIEARMLIWSRGAKRIVNCEGDAVDTDGKPYECTLGGFRNRKEHEEAGHVCEPRISITFRLADNPDLGLFRFETGAWSLASVIARAIGDLSKIDGDAKATLALELVDLGDRKFTKPVLSVKGAL